MLLNACDLRTFLGIRDRFLIMFLLGTGCRRNEAINVTLNDIDLDEGIVRVMGKGKKARTIPYGHTLTEEIQKYLTVRSSLDGNHPYLLISRLGPRLSYGGIGNVFKRLARVAGIEDVRISAHSFRHTYAVRYLRNGGRISDLSENMGHSSISITEIYLKTSATELKKEAIRCDTLRGIDFEGY